MVNKISGFRDQPLAVVLAGGDHGLNRLLAELSRTVLDPPVDELAGVGDLGARLSPLPDAPLQVVQAEIGHGFTALRHRVSRAFQLCSSVLPCFAFLKSRCSLGGRGSGYEVYGERFRCIRPRNS